MVGALAAPAATFASPAKTATSAMPYSVTVVKPVTASTATLVNFAKPVTVAKAEPQNLISNVIKKAITAALRYGGNYLGKLLGKLSPSAGGFVTKYSGKIADFLDSISNWQENIIASGLVSIGIPPIEAYEIAAAIVWLAGL